MLDSATAACCVAVVRVISAARHCSHSGRCCSRSDVAEPPSKPRGWVEAFAGLALQQPLVLFVDDWQWADDASHQVLAAVQRLSDAAALLIVLTRRLSGAPGEVTPGVQTIALEPLDNTTAAQAVGRSPARGRPLRRGRRFVARAGGNPLFIEELCHSAARGDSGRLAALSSPAGWLNQLIESRVQRLSPALVEHGAHGRRHRQRRCRPGCWPASPAARPTARCIRELAEHDLLFPGEHAGTLRFKHGVTRDVIYASVGLLARQVLHLRIGAALMQHAAASGEEDAEALALHFGAGGDPALEAHYAERAGDRALAASALDRARAHYRAALTALERGELAGERALRWVDIAQRLAMVCMFDPERNQIQLAERAVALAERHGDALRVARARHWLGCVNYALGEPRVAIAHGERALREAEQAGDEPLAVQVMASLGEAHTAAGQYERATALLDRAIDIKRSHRSGRHTNVGLAYSLVCRGVMLGDHGRFAASADCFDQALECVVGLTHQIGASIQGWRAAVLLWQGRWGIAREAASSRPASPRQRAACGSCRSHAQSTATRGGCSSARPRRWTASSPSPTGSCHATADCSARSPMAGWPKACASWVVRPKRNGMPCWPCSEAVAATASAWRWPVERWRAPRRKVVASTRHSANWLGLIAWRADASRRTNSP